MATLQRLLRNLWAHERPRHYLVFGSVAITLACLAITLVQQIELPTSHAIGGADPGATAVDDTMVRQINGMADEPGGVATAGLQIHEPALLAHSGHRAEDNFITVLDANDNEQDCVNPHVDRVDYQVDVVDGIELVTLTAGDHPPEEDVERPDWLARAAGETEPTGPATDPGLSSIPDETPPSAPDRLLELTPPASGDQPAASPHTHGETATVDQLLNESPWLPWPAASDAPQQLQPTAPEPAPSVESDWQLQPYSPAAAAASTAAQLQLGASGAEQPSALPEMVPFAAEPVVAGRLQAPHVAVQVAPVGLPPESRQHVASMVQRAIGQAERGAMYLSRQQLLESLRSLSWMLDRSVGGREHDKALSEALLALDEADDFSLTRVDHQSNTDLDNFIMGHGTDVLKHAVAPNPMEARDAYYDYARETLIAATGSEPIAAQALYALARVEAGLRARAPRGQHKGPRELPLYEAALAIHPQHSVAANELGVALARDGQLQRAVRWFLHSAKWNADPRTLANLSKVYSQLGNHRAASQLQQKLAASSYLPSPDVRTIPLMTLEQFNAELRGHGVDRIPVAARAGRPFNTQPAGYAPAAPQPAKSPVSELARRLFSGTSTRSRSR